MTMKEYNSKKNEWTKQNKDRILLVLPKGTKEEIKKYAEFNNMSVNSVIAKLIDKGIKRDLNYRFKLQCDDEEEKIQMPWD